MVKALEILTRDSERLSIVDRYLHGDHNRPYMPDGATGEYRLLAERAVTNLCQLVVETPSQALYVDGFRSGGARANKDSFETKHWQASRLDQRQLPVHYAALAYGVSYTLTERNKKAGKTVTSGLSSLRTVVLYEDPTIDLDPVAAVYIRKHSNEQDKRDGEIWYWDGENKIVFASAYDGTGLKVKMQPEAHGASECPVTPFYAYRDLDGRAWGVIEPLIPLQDRLNQTIFDLLVAQTYTSFEVRTVTGMAPPMKMQQDEDGLMEPVLDENNNPIPDRQYLNASRWFYAEDEDVKFGSLPGGDLGGFIESAETAIRHLSAISQTPPHFLLGQIANISAEALEAAETALTRKVESFRQSFGESWERSMRIAAEIEGDETAASDEAGEALWRDMGASSLAQSADALGKFAEALEIPRRALWSRVPGATSGEVAEWEKIRREDDRELQLTQNLYGRGGLNGNTTAEQPANNTNPADDGGGASGGSYVPRSTRRAGGASVR